MDYEYTAKEINERVSSIVKEAMILYSLTTYLNSVIANQKKTINELEVENASLENRLEEIESKGN